MKTGTLTDQDMLTMQRAGMKLIEACNEGTSQGVKKAWDTRHAHEMSKDERDKEIQWLEDNHKEALAAPRMMDGNISPMQVGMMSAGQKDKWQRNVAMRDSVEARVRELSKSDDQLKSEHRAHGIAKAKSEKDQILSMHKTYEGLGPMSHRANGKLKPTYQRNVDTGLARIEELHKQFPELKQ